MKYLKSLGLLAVAAAALMAFVGTASATTVTSFEGATPNIAAASANTEFHGAFVSVKCSHSTLEGDVVEHGAGPVGGAVDALSFSGCNYTVTVENKGGFTVSGTSRTGDGTVTSFGMKLTIHTSVGSCAFTTNGTDIGTIDGGSPAVLNINSVKIPRTTGHFLCGTSAVWTGSYTVNNPSGLEVH